MGWLKRRREQRQLLTLSDPAFLDFFGLGRGNSGVFVSEHTALTLSAVWRAVNLIAGTIAGLPLKTFRTLPDDTRERVASFLDSPAGPDSLTPFAWIELVLVHLLLHGNAFLLHRRDQIGRLIGLDPIHPNQVSVERDTNVAGGRLFRVTTNDGETVNLDARTMKHVMGLSTDGVRGISVISAARDSLGTYTAGERSAARMFANGMLVSGLVTPREGEDLTEDDAIQIKESLRAKVLGSENAGDIAVVNRSLDFQKWMLTSEEAQFLESRAFQVEDVARWFGIAPHLLMQTEKQTSWGTGIEEQHRALSRHTLMPWTSRLEQALSTLLNGNRFAEFDHSGLQQPNLKDEINTLVLQVQNSLLTVNEARRIRNLPPVPDGDIPAFARDLEATPIGFDPEDVEPEVE